MTTIPTTTPEATPADRLSPSALQAAAAAMGATPMPIAGIKLRTFTTRDMAILRQLNSPILARLQGQSAANGEGAELPVELDNAFDAIFLLSVPSKEAAALLAKGLPAYREAAEDTCGQLSVAAVYALFQAVVSRIIASCLKTD